MAWYDYFYTPAKGGYEGLSGKDAYEGAAKGAGGVAQQGFAFSDEQWRRQMEGLNQAQGYYGPANSYWQAQYGGQGSGTGENWYDRNQSQFGAPQRSSQAYDATQRWAMDPLNNATQNGATTAGQYMGGTSNQQTSFNQMGQGLQNYNGPQYGAQQWAQFQPQFGQAGSGENWWAQNQNRYNQETNAQGAYEQGAPQLYQQSATEQFLKQGGIGSDVANAALAGHQQWGQGQTALQRNEGENKGYIRGANQAQDYYQSQLGNLAGPGQYEQFISADIAGANPYFERARQRTIDTVNQEMARRGGFQTPAAVDRIGNAVGALEAEDYQRRADRAQQAQQMQLSRIGQGQQAAQGVSALDLQRAAGLGSLDTQSEQAQLGRQNFGMQAEKNASDERIQRDQLRLQAAKQSDDAKLARLMGASQMGQGADSSNLGMLNAGQSASNAAQEQLLARLMGGMNASNQLDQTRISADNQALQRMLASYNMGAGADAYRMQQGQQFYNMGQGIDQSNMARYNMVGNQANQADQFDLARLLGQGNMAFQSQDAEQQRKAQAFAALFGLNNAQAGQVGGFYDQGGKYSGAAFEDAMSALMAKYGFQAQGDAANGKFALELAALAKDYGSGGKKG